MSRMWFVLAGVGTINIVSAFAVAFAPPLFRDPSSIEQPFLQPVLTIYTADSKFEQRVRNVLRREMDGGSSGSVFGPPSSGFTRTGLQTAGSPDVLTRPLGTPAMLTPFGLYPAGFKGVGLIFLSLSTLLVAGSLVTYLTPKRIHSVHQAIELSWSNVALLAAVGALGYGISALLLFVLITLVVGIPFAALLAVVVTAGTALGFMGVCLALGRFVRSSLDLPFSSPLLELMLGIALIFPLGILPVVGWPLILAIVAVGFGALVVTKGGTGDPWSISLLQEQNNDPLT